MGVCLSHMREPNDNKLAEKTDGIMDIILGGHDHYYSHNLIKGTHVLRSGSDFQQLSYIEAWRKQDGSGWDFDITRRDVTSEIQEHEPTVELVRDLTSKLQQSLSRPVGWTAMPLDARFSTVRMKESNIGNFVCDVMRQYHHADCTIMASGTIRGGQIYPPGAIRIKDITTCFPFEDPVVLLRVTGQAIWDALENGVSTYPALEGRFPQVSGIEFGFDPAQPSGKRLTSLLINGEQYEPERKYKLATRGYMGRGKDGYMPLLVRSEGDKAWSDFLQRRLGLNKTPINDDSDSDSEGEPEDPDAVDDDAMDFQVLLMRKFWTKWALRAKVKASVCDPLKEGEMSVDWTRTIAPGLEGRIKMVQAQG